ncbi:recombinase family protein [Mucilaginibacter flavus]|uniref:recombinase family protein n=1 Tax=Mucilaginibacter flavus TaxID=931504 RepID=UPI0025B443B7|nr:recombinase family protein [Mucilaginibacter flavus]MDN3581881.1 recombinase family protein [Mucilaginibacter flavus]
MTKEHINYFIYARKSTEGEERQSLSIDGQLNDIQQIVKRENLTVIDTITDIASAAIPYNRPGYTEMIRQIKKGKATGIIVWHVDRLIRNELEDGELRWMLQTGIIKSVWTPNREYRSHDNALLISIEASMAAQYSRDLSAKVKRGNKQKYELGHPLGPARLGYLNTKFQNHGTNYLINDPERFHLIQKGFRMLLTGRYNIMQVVATLQEMGLRSRGTKRYKSAPIPISTMYKVFTDQFYAGYFTRNGTTYKGCYTPMITLDEFDKIQFFLGRKGKPKHHKHDYAFTGFITCASCGCFITATKVLKHIKALDQYKTYVFYHCTKKRGRQNCAEKHYTKEEDMEAMISAELAKITLKPLFAEWAINAIKEDSQHEIELRQKLLESTTQYLRKINNEVERLLDLRISGEISEETYSHKKNEREQMSLRVQERKNRLQNQIDDWETQFNDLIEFSKTAIEKFNLGDVHIQKELCDTLGSNWILKGKKLMFSRLEWFDTVESLITHFDEETTGSQPIKSYADYRQSTGFNVGILMLRRLREQIATFKQKSTLNFPTSRKNMGLHP